MLHVQTEKRGIVILKHFGATPKHVRLLTEIVQDDTMRNMSLSCTDHTGREFSVPAFMVNVDPKLIRQMNVDLK
ncbi:hypothetical protein EPO33_02080 [Patescibacteria group bacterium]|nr:MAG: hypothetical protein EPO33_02080 [Patescibacteria group bacterium]